MSKAASNSADTIHDIFENVFQRVNTNELTVNAYKCQILPISSSSPVGIVSFGQPIVRKESCKNLGLYLDNKVLQETYSYITNKMNKECWILFTKLGICIHLSSCCFFILPMQNQASNVGFGIRNLPKASNWSIDIVQLLVLPAVFSLASKQKDGEQARLHYVYERTGVENYAH